MDKITLCDLEVHYRVGVPDVERSQPQRLLITIEMERSLERAGQSDDLAETIDYYAVAQRVLHFGDEREWRLIEKVATDVAQRIWSDFQPARVSVEVKKFILPEARWVSVRRTFPRSE